MVPPPSLGGICGLATTWIREGSNCRMAAVEPPGMSLRRPPREEAGSIYGVILPSTACFNEVCAQGDSGPKEKIILAANERE